MPVIGSTRYIKGVATMKFADTMLTVLFMAFMFIIAVMMAAGFDKIGGVQ